ncbi:MAG: matrixin family metalloprotease [Candidatus Melainabacteria bacterium]
MTALIFGVTLVLPALADNYYNYAVRGYPVCREMPVKVYFNRTPGVKNWSSKNMWIARNAMRLWQEATKNRVRFTEVASPSSADAILTWQATYKDPASGQYLGGITSSGRSGEKITNARTILTTTHPTKGYAYNDTQLAANTNHEFGHILGIKGHSPNPTDLMSHTPTSMRSLSPTARDVETLNMIYDHCGR